MLRVVFGNTTVSYSRDIFPPFHSRDKKRPRRSEDRVDGSITGSEINAVVASSEERRREKERRERRERSKEKNNKHKPEKTDREKSRKSHRSEKDTRRSRSRERRDRDKYVVSDLLIYHHCVLRLIAIFSSERESAATYLLAMMLLNRSVLRKNHLTVRTDF